MQAGAFSIPISHLLLLYFISELFHGLANFLVNRFLIDVSVSFESLIRSSQKAATSLPVTLSTPFPKAAPSSNRSIIPESKLVPSVNSTGPTLKRYFSVSYTHLRAHETRHDLVC